MILTELGCERLTSVLCPLTSSIGCWMFGVGRWVFVAKGISITITIKSMSMSMSTSWTDGCSVL
jgi:hypothetical protein